MARRSRLRGSCAGPRRLRRLQQGLSRKQRGSNNRTKAVVKVAKAHARVADTRRDWQHKLSPHGSSATTKRCTSRTCALPVSAGPGWPSPCTTPAGRRSSGC
ncbi:transposase [Micromonospora phytophila]|uniref:transposase n=1 Tax=Micromonospora phytophila TaxID=709888 RepID=UPI0035566B6F